MQCLLVRVAVLSTGKSQTWKLSYVLICWLKNAAMLTKPSSVSRKSSLGVKAGMWKEISMTQLLCHLVHWLTMRSTTFWMRQLKKICWLALRNMEQRCMTITIIIWKTTLQRIMSGRWRSGFLPWLLSPFMASCPRLILGWITAITYGLPAFPAWTKTVLGTMATLTSR